MREVRARMPPSPLLSARITKPTYLIVMTTTSDQKTSESTPRTFASVGATPCAPPKHSRIAYSGLVPMSPYTTPIAASDNGWRRVESVECGVAARIIVGRSSPREMDMKRPFRDAKGRLEDAPPFTLRRGAANVRKDRSRMD